MGIEKTMLLARDFVKWVNMNTDIEGTIKNYHV